MSVFAVNRDGLWKGLPRSVPEAATNAIAADEHGRAGVQLPRQNPPLVDEGGMNEKKVCWAALTSYQRHNADRREQTCGYFATTAYKSQPIIPLTLNVLLQVRGRFSISLPRSKSPGAIVS